MSKNKDVQKKKVSTTDDVDLAKIKMLFYKHDIKFDVKELQLK